MWDDTYGGRVSKARIDWERENRHGGRTAAAGVGTAAAGVAGVGLGLRGDKKAHGQIRDILTGKDKSKSVYQKTVPSKVSEAFGSKKAPTYKPTGGLAGAARKMNRSSMAVGAGVAGIAGGYGLAAGGRARQSQAQPRLKRIQNVQKSKSKGPKVETKNKTRNVGAGMLGAGLAGGAIHGKKDAKSSLEGIARIASRTGAGKAPRSALPMAASALAASTGGMLYGSAATDRRRVKKSQDSASLKRAKRTQAGLSATSGTLGIGALGALGASAALKSPRAASRIAARTGKSTAQLNRSADKAKGASAGLTTVGAGVGGLGSMNLARVNLQEANAIPTPSNPLRRRLNKSLNQNQTVQHNSQALYNLRRRKSTARPKPNVVKGFSAEEITEHVAKNYNQHRANASRRNKDRAMNVAGLGGAAMVGAAGLGAVRGVKVAPQTGNVVRGLKTTGALARSGPAARKGIPKYVGATARRNPYGAAQVAGGAGYAGGMGAAGIAGVNQKRHENQVVKSFNPEHRRDARMDTASIGAGAVGGAAGVGAVRHGKDALSNLSSSAKMENKARAGGPGSHKQFGAALNFKNRGLKSTGKAAGLGAVALGAGMGAQRIQSYKRNSGGSYRPRYRGLD